MRGGVPTASGGSLYGGMSHVTSPASFLYRYWFSTGVRKITSFEASSTERPGLLGIKQYFTPKNRYNQILP